METWFKYMLIPQHSIASTQHITAFCASSPTQHAGPIIVLFILWFRGPHWHSGDNSRRQKSWVESGPSKHPPSPTMVSPHHNCLSHLTWRCFVHKVEIVWIFLVLSGQFLDFMKNKNSTHSCALWIDLKTTNWQKQTLQIRVSEHLKPNIEKDVLDSISSTWHPRGVVVRILYLRNRLFFGL